MQKAFITAVSGTPGALTRDFERKFFETIKSCNIGTMDTETLSTGHAIDVTIYQNHPELLKKLRGALANFSGFDIFVQPDEGYRKKKILIADMDATMIEGETLDDIAEHFGIKDQIAPITAAAMRGEIDFAEALNKRVALLKDKPISALYDVLSKSKVTKCSEVLVKTMKINDAYAVLVSGGFDIFTKKIGNILGFNKDISNKFDIADEKLTGRVIPPIVDKNTKKKILEETARDRGLSPAATIAVGDGANDIPMLQAAGIGVGYFGKPAVQTATPYQIRHSDLTAMLYLQGYRDRDFAV